MRTISGAVLVASLLVPFSVAHAAVVMQLGSNNMFANAVSTDPETGISTGVFVTREKGKGNPGGTVDSIFVIISSSSGASFVGGTLPQGAFQVSAQSASLDVDISEIAVTNESGDLPETGVISVDWSAGDVTRTSGSTRFEFDNTHVNIVGTSTSAAASITGSVLGTAMVDPFGDLSTTKNTVIIVTKD